MAERLPPCPDCALPQHRIDEEWIACIDIVGCSWSEVVQG